VDAVLGLLTRLGRELDDDATRALGTLVGRLPTLLTEQRAADLAALTDQVPRLLRGLESGNLPSTADLGRMPLDLRALLELMDDLHQVVSGLPGAGRARDRGDDPHPQVEDPRPPDEADAPPAVAVAPADGARADGAQADGAPADVVPAEEAQPQA
jgi:hypothetical protein